MAYLSKLWGNHGCGLYFNQPLSSEFVEWFHHLFKNVSSSRLLSNVL